MYSEYNLKLHVSEHGSTKIYILYLVQMITIPPITLELSISKEYQFPIYGIFFINLPKKKKKIIIIKNINEIKINKLIIIIKNNNDKNNKL